jgi:hypothetical protein
MSTSVTGTPGDDMITAVAMDGAGDGFQVHVWPGQGNDTIELSFDSNFNATKPHSQGHHVRGDESGGDGTPGGVFSGGH